MKKLVVVVVAGLILGACSADTKVAVPDVVGKPLDVAQSQLDDAGLEYVALGGGTFGIVVESNWTVCRTEPAAGATSEDKVKLIVDRTCTETQSGAVGETSTSTATSSTSAPPSSTSTAPTTSPTVASSKIRVPNVVGMDLQAAQDTMQAAGLYILTSHDSTGRGRMQLLDRNWLVTEQSPAAGSMVAETQLIDLGARKFTD